MKNKVKTVIIGGGAVVKEYYLPAFVHLKILDSVTIVEPDHKAAAFLRLSGLEVVEKTFEDFFKTQTKYDYAIITVPNHLHEAAIKLCLENKITVLCEKPLCLTTESCYRIKQQQEKDDKKVYTGMVRRYLPSFKALKASLHLLGEIKAVQLEDGNPFAWVADSYAFFDPKNGGVLADMGSHYLDLLYDLFGNLNPISYNDDCEGGVEANCKYELQTKNNIPISVKLSRTHQLKNRLEIIGEKGKLWMEKDKFDTCFFSPDNHTIHEITVDKVFKDPNLRYIFESCFVEQLSCLFEEDESLVDLKQATDVVNLIEWAYKSRIEIIDEAINSQDSYFITGGTGFIGTALIERLWAKGVRNIKSPVRNYKNCAPIGRFKIELPRLNLLNYDAVKKSLENKKYVIHLAYATDGKNAYDTNVTATQNVVKAACEQGAEAVVVMSTMNVYGFPNGSVTENSKQDYAGGDYGKTKKIMQEWCLNFAQKQTKTRIILLNPTCVYGPNGKTYTTLPIILAKHNRFCWVDEGKGMANVVFIENLLDAIEKATKVEAAHGQNFIITDGAVTWKEFLTPLLGELANEITTLSKADLLNSSFVEKSSLKGITRYLLSNWEFVSLINAHPFFGPLKKTLFSKLPSFRERLDDQRQIVWSALSANNLTKTPADKFNPPVWLNELFGNNQSYFSNEKASKILGWQPQIDIKTGLDITKRWLESNES